jgi:prefoldin subunit 5
MGDRPQDADMGDRPHGADMRDMPHMPRHESCCKWATVIVAVVVVLVAVGVAVYMNMPVSEVVRTDSQAIEELRTAIREQKKQIDEMTGELSRLRMEVESRPTQRELENLQTKMESKVTDDTQPLRASQNEASLQIDDIKAKIIRLRSDVDSQTQLNNTVNTLQARAELTTQALSQVTQSLSDCSCLATWTQIKITHLGCSTLQSTGTTPFNFPSSIPNSAKEVLVYVQVQVGSSGPRDSRSNLKIYTEEGSKQYEQFIGVHAYDQDASGNMWFPLTSNRKIHLEVPIVHSRKVKFHISAIGYR